MTNDGAPGVASTITVEMRVVHHLSQLGPWQNPVAVRELRSRMRGRRPFVVLTLYSLLLSGIVTLIYVPFTLLAEESASQPRSLAAGRAIFNTTVTIQTLLVIFIVPFVTAGSISGEKEQQTFQLLRTTTLSARALINGKLISALSYALLLILATWPFQSLVFLLGGVTGAEVFIANLLLIVGAVLFALIGLRFSGLKQTTRDATLNSIVFVLLTVFLVPFMAMLLLPSYTSRIGHIFLFYVSVCLVATNLPATLVYSQSLLRDEGALFYFSDMVVGNTFYAPSPWLLNLVFSALLSRYIYRAIVKQVQRVPEQ